MKIKVGDKVEWPGGPNEFRNNRCGTVLSIKKGIAVVSGARQVPMKILKLKKKEKYARED